jgi:predicted nucleic acid-binding protein
VKRTYVDSGVLIAAARGNGRLAERALAIIGDTTDREFVCSDYVKFETIPKPRYFGRTAEAEFYETYFRTAVEWLYFDALHMEEAFEEACRSGLQSFDALHVVVAALSACDELVTSEKPTSSIHRTSLIPVISIDTDDTD